VDLSAIPHPSHLGFSPAQVRDVQLDVGRSAALYWEAIRGMEEAGEEHGGCLSLCWLPSVHGGSELGCFWGLREELGMPDVTMGRLMHLTRSSRWNTREMIGAGLLDQAAQERSDKAYNDREECLVSFLEGTGTPVVRPADLGV